MIDVKEDKYNSYPKLLYLDQKDWDQLEKAYYQPQNNQDVKRVLDKICVLINNEKLRIPIDINRMIEINQRTIYKTRRELTDLMVKLSNFYYVLPGVSLEEYEINNYFYRKMGVEQINIREIAISQDIQNLFVGKPTIESDQLDEMQKLEINKIIEDHISSNEYINKSFTSYIKKDEIKNLNHISRAETTRMPLFSMKNDKERVKYQIHQDFIGLIKKISEVYNFTELYDAFLEKYDIPNTFDTTKRKREFLKEFPLYYTLCMLCDFRDRNLERPIEGNDLIDVISLSLPIVYFDYVIAEKYFITLAKQAKLDNLYGTVLLKKIVDIEGYLDKL